MVKDATQTCDASSSNEDDGPVATSQGSCYEFATHAVTCDVAAADCTDADGKAHYEPGFVGSSGCCHCEASSTTDHAFLSLVWSQYWHIEVTGVASSSDT